MANFILWGATGQSIVLEDILTSQNHIISALFDNNINIKSPFSNVPLYYGQSGFYSWKAGLSELDDIYFSVAIGGSNSRSREEIYSFLLLNQLKPKTIIHTSATIAHSACLGDGCQILTKSCICPRTSLGKSVIVNTAASIDHESVIGDFVHVGPQAAILGNVKIGTGSFIGANSTILPNIIIGSNTIIGAGSIVTKNIPDNVIAFGAPARVVRKIKKLN